MGASNSKEMNFLTWLKHLFAASPNGQRTTEEPSPLRWCEHCHSPIVAKSSPPPKPDSNKKPKSAKPSLIPKEEFQALLDKAGVRYFTAQEVFYRGARDARLKINTDPPREFWPSLVAVVRVADEARHRLGKPLKINSAYRSPAYNRALSGAASNSYHTKGAALDLAGSPITLHKILTQMRKEGVFKGGIGKYRTFTHVDVRGKNADWTG